MKRTIIAVTLILCSKVIFAQQPVDTIRTGVYLKALYDFNSSAYSYDVDLWMWFRYTNDSLKPLESIEIANAKKYEYLKASTDKSEGIIWASQNCKATINQNWDLQHYPFDHQKLEVILEESQLDSRSIVLLTDRNKFEFSDQIDVKGWRIDSTSIKNGTSHYKSSFGDPTLNGESKYSKVMYSIYLSRDSWSLFFKLFTGCYVAFFVAFLVFFIKPIHVDPRFGLSIGGLFAAVGNKYVVDSNIPEGVSFTLVDKVHDITFVYILLTILVSLISLKMYDNGNVFKQIKFDKIMSIIVLGTYISINVLIIILTN